MSFKSLITLAVAVALQTTLSTACTPANPPIKDANTVTVALRADLACCDAPFQTTNMGVLDECHTATAGFLSLTEAVGQNMFNRGIHIWTFSDSNCQDDGRTIQLSNSEGCVFAGDDVVINSFLISARAL
ncbi:hypothetical protein MVEN_00643700 [Mycena venus]|uniref:Uncharacterized protein n=1 Tax=Mycena venus TaxID=2733690 RepID=A0A8H6YPT2_9AGAR|nr:hypothetical protein MVEN_00643700 [Mycena venus]